MKRRRRDSDTDLFGAAEAPQSVQGVSFETDGTADIIAIDSPMVASTKIFMERRSRQLGNVITSEHAAEYVAILRAFADFRARHEPEPLHEDLAVAVCGEDATADSLSAFQSYIRQLKAWKLVDERIEKERLRGYRDTRRTKFRYRLCDDAIAFVAWLAEMHEHDLNPVAADITGNLLDMQKSLVAELGRMLHRVDHAGVTYETASDVMFRVQKVSEYVESTERTLQDLNLRLLGFVAEDFSPADAKVIVDELGVFLERFGRRFGPLRDEIVRDIGEMMLERHQKRWTACVDRFRAEASRFKYITAVRVPDAMGVLADAIGFYGPEGKLSSLVNRVNDSARKVWGRLNAKLRELERRNHRLDDIAARLQEFAELDEDTVPHDWMRRLVSSAAMRGDPQIRPGGEKSIAPRPKVKSRESTRRAPCWITPRKVGERPDVASISQVRAARLKEWMRQTGIYPDGESTIMLSSGVFSTYEDCANIVRVIRSTRLTSGEQTCRRLSVSGVPSSAVARVGIRSATLEFEDMRLSAGPRE